MKKILTMFLAIISVSQVRGEDVSWNTSIRISSATQTASDARVAVDLTGNSVAVWIENNLVKASYQAFGGSWGTAATLSNSGASSPKIAMDKNGNATAIWLENGFIKTSTRPPGIGMAWGAVKKLSISSGASAPQLAVDPQGDLVAIWARAGFIESSTKFIRGNWPAAPNVLATGGNADSPHVAIGTDNVTVAAVWHDSNNTIFAANKLLGNDWNEPIAIGQGTGPRAAVDSQGNTLAVWYRFDLTGPSYTDVVLQGATKLFQENWSFPVDISQPGIRNPTDLVARVRFDSHGNAIALWNNSFDGFNFTVQSSTLALNENGNWSTPLTLVGPLLYAYDLDLGVDANGDALSIFMFNSGTSLSIRSLESDIDASTIGWGTSATISSGTKNAFPRISSTLNGNNVRATAVWINNGTINSVFASNATGTIVQPATGLTITPGVTNLGVFTENFYTFKWNASVSSSIAHYLVYRNGELIATLGSSTFQFKDDNRKLHEPGFYGVAAVNNEGMQSTTATINFPP